DVRVVPADGGQRFVTTARGGDDIEVRATQHRFDPRAHERVVVRQEDAGHRPLLKGIETRKVVPSALLSSASSPPSWATRSLIERGRRTATMSSNPMPLS